MPAATFSLPKDKIRFLLLEGIHNSALERLRADGYTNVDYETGSYGEDELASLIGDYHFLGIRSRAQVTERVLKKAKKLAAIGCFCIGTNQVDLKTAKRLGIPVFNAPHSNTRSVAELVIGELIMLMRGIPQKTTAAHRGEWMKSPRDSREVRGKTLGIVGYGHIGSQVGVLAEGLGLRVQYYDIEDKLPYGNAQPVESLKDLLRTSDVVTLHVPGTELTKGMIGLKQLKEMKQGSFLINTSRGSVVVIDALVEALQSRHLGGASVDVFPQEPKSNSEEFVSPLRDLENVLLTPHIGGSTMEAQANIGKEVADKLIQYSNNGSTRFAVNFPEVSLPPLAGNHRFMHIHENKPGMMSAINAVFADLGINVAGQYLQIDGEIGYVITDSEPHPLSRQVTAKLRSIPGTIKSRCLY